MTNSFLCFPFFLPASQNFYYIYTGEDKYTYVYHVFKQVSK